MVTAPEVTMVVAASSPGRQLVRRPGTSQRGQDVEVPVGETRLREHRPELGVQASASRCSRPMTPIGDVQVRPLPAPLLHDPADVIEISLHPSTLSSLEDKVSSMETIRLASSS